MQNCEWIISFSDGYKIKLDFIDFDLEYQSTCQYDWLEIRNGNASTSPLIGNRRCGDNIPGSVLSSGNQLYMKFSSDGSKSRSGFEINVSKSNATGKPLTLCQYFSIFISFLIKLG